MGGKIGGEGACREEGKGKRIGFWLRIAAARSASLDLAGHKGDQALWFPPEHAAQRLRGACESREGLQSRDLWFSPQCPHLA